MSDEIRKLVTRSLIAAGVLKGMAGAEPAKDERPRFRNGRLKDEWERLNEELDLELVHDPVLGPAYGREHKAEIDRWVELKADRERDERDAKNVAISDQEAAEMQRDLSLQVLDREQADLDQRRAALAPPEPPAE